ncbi:hypothetical protein [Actinoplanes subtropicus]|uniref:hypothetical protein n=1 Tax=Actinoplanes subtropicus TaxID=543632 RepID=UPI000A0472E8|nr:hypothetical protein [Actinoplanes subtropicus]
MSDTDTDTAGRSGPGNGCCGNSPQATRGVPEPVAEAPCCGTPAEAKAENSCCGSSARSTAVAAGQGCCG